MTPEKPKQATVFRAPESQVAQQREKSTEGLQSSRSRKLRLALCVVEMGWEVTCLMAGKGREVADVTQ